MSALLGIVLVSLAGCALPLPGLPSADHPTCSWTSTIPNNHDKLCTLAFHTLRTILTADSNGNDATVRRLVTNRTVAQKIITFGRQKRAEGLIEMHIVPTLTLGFISGGLLGVAFNLTGKTQQGNIQAPQQVFLRVRGQHATVVQDQPEQEW